jgi:hypothetical protein
VPAAHLKPHEATPGFAASLWPNRVPKANHAGLILVRLAFLFEALGTRVRVPDRNFHSLFGSQLARARQASRCYLALRDED